MYIQPNILLTPTEKLIKPYECSFIVIEGPNMKGKLSLEGLEIKYDSFYLSQLILNINAKDQPLMYGFLGESVTFLMIRAKYLPTDPNWAIESEQYIQYYYKDDPGQIRTMGQLLVLTGNSINRIPQIFFNNPSNKYKVFLEVLMANLPQVDLTNFNQYSKNSQFSGLYWNNIISDIFDFKIDSTTGSTELKIIDTAGNPLIFIPYQNIRTINNIGNNTIIIGLDTEEKVKLEFLSKFNCDQAYSRISWALESTKDRFLTTSQPSLDLESPIFTWNEVLSGSTTGITSGTTTLYFIPSGTTYVSDDIKSIFLSGITDNRDGNMSIYDSNVEIYKLNDLVPIYSINEVGIYKLYFTIYDLASNINIKEIYVSIYE